MIDEETRRWYSQRLLDTLKENDALNSIQLSSLQFRPRKTSTINRIMKRMIFTVGSFVVGVGLAVVIAMFIRHILPEGIATPLNMFEAFIIGFSSVMMGLNIPLGTSS